MDPAKSHPEYVRLYKTAFNFPAIDNHAHPLLRAEHRNTIPFEGLISEAEGRALSEDAIHTLACYRATSQLAELFQLTNPSWDDIKIKRSETDYVELCKKCFDPTRIQCILIDDGLGVQNMAEDHTWHDQFTHSPTRRVVRIEIVAQGILDELFKIGITSDLSSRLAIFDTFSQRLTASLTANANDNQVVAFKSIVCYRTGLDVCPDPVPQDEISNAVLALSDEYQRMGHIRLKNKVFNDQVVRIALGIATTYKKPVQFHTGLGDNDIPLRHSSPSHLQPLIEAYPSAPIVLLHSSYPYTREAGYLTSVYGNVYLDFGEVFPFVSARGQRSIIHQILELTPTNKIMWSTDGHWYPESYYLGTIQARQALYDVLSETIRSGELTELQAIKIIENALFHNANRIYHLDLQPYQGVD